MRGQAGSLGRAPSRASAEGGGAAQAASWRSVCACGLRQPGPPVCLPRAAPSSRRPRAPPPGRPSPQGSGGLCSCGAPGESAGRRGAAGTLPPTPPTPASPSRSLRAQAPAVSESLCASTAATASATPSASTSSRQAPPAPGGGRAQGGPRGIRVHAEAWTRPCGHSHAGWSRARSLSGFRDVCDSLRS